jgi:hypothetical protein
MAAADLICLSQSDRNRVTAPRILCVAECRSNINCENPMPTMSCDFARRCCRFRHDLLRAFARKLFGYPISVIDSFLRNATTTTDRWTVISRPSHIGVNWSVQNFSQSEPSRRGSAPTQRYLSVLSLHMRTDTLSTPTMNQTVTAHRHALRISIVRTGGSVE